MKDGDWVKDNKGVFKLQDYTENEGEERNIFTNITCIKGTLYRTKKIEDIPNTRPQFSAEITEDAEMLDVTKGNICSFKSHVS